MTIIANKLATASAASVSASLFNGKGKQARTIAFMQIGTLAFSEEQSRAASMANMRSVLGKSPTESQIKAARVERIIGRVASRLPVSELPKGKTGPADRMEYARTVVCSYAAPAKEGAKARKLRAGQTGRRSTIQQRVVRAAEEECSLFFGDLGLGAARGLKEKNSRATRASKVNVAKGAKDAKGAAPSHAELVKPTAPVSSDDYVQHMQTQLASLVDYDKKNAKKRPTTHGKFAELLAALRQCGNEAANAYQVRKNAADAKAAEAGK